MLRTIAEARKFRQDAGQKSVGLVPTMGALHAGHLSLVQTAKQQTDLVWASIFVNPAQFAPHEDFNKYPRNVDADVTLLEKEGVSVVFAPTDPKEMYPNITGQGDKTQRVFVVPVGVEDFDKSEGKARPGHFRGVATVVTKLFNILQPTKAFFGQKDGLQSIVIQQLVRELNFPVDVVICPTVREEDGLAMSSRNVYLNREQRLVAPVLFQALSAVKQSFEANNVRSKRKLELEAFQVFQSSPRNSELFKVEYLSFIDRLTGLEIETDQLPASVMVSAAINFTNCRILDNVMCSE